MNKQDNKLAVSVLATLIAAIALIYTLIMYRNILFAVIGTSALFLITAFFLTQNLIAFSAARNKALNLQFKNSINDITMQLDAMNEVQSKLSKANYLYTRQAAQTVSILKDNYTESQSALYKNIATLSNMQNKATKIMLKCDQRNTGKVISAIRDMRNNLNETMIQGFDQIQPNNEEIVTILTELVNYLKTQSGSMDQSLGLQLNNVAHELQNISNSIQHVQITAPAQPVMTNAAPVEEATQNLTEEFIEDIIPDTVIEEATVTEEPVIEEMIETKPIIEDVVPEIIEEKPVVETITEYESLAEEIVPEIIKEEPIEEKVVEEPQPAVPDKSPNDMLSPDEIAALFAAAEPTPKTEPEPIEEPFTPTFTVVGKSDENDLMEEPEPVPTVGDINNNPNKQLSPDEIAALFAAAEPTPKTAEPEPITPISDDPNKQLSPDEIAALFSSLG